jgi:hypothetical protein
MKACCRKFAAILLLGNSAVVKAQPRSPIAPRKPSAPVPKPAASVPKPLAAAPKPAASVPKPLAAAPKPAASVPKPKSPVPGSDCPNIAPYNPPPATQCANCYKDMNALTTYISNTSNVVSATVCSGTYALPATAAVDNSKVTSLTLSCCGSASSCVIDGGAASSPPVKRTKRLFTFQQPIALDIQGITFQNFDCPNCKGAILSTDTSALVTFKHNTVRKVNSYDVSTFHMVSLKRNEEANAVSSSF